MVLYAKLLCGLVSSPNGLIKLVFDNNSNIIMGLHIYGVNACELIHYLRDEACGGRTGN
jgi:hypothetical protein